MTGKLKTLGLALAATLALGAVAASQASAIYELHSGSGSGTTYLTAAQSGSPAVLDTPAGTISCSSVTGKGTFAGTTTPEGTVQDATFNSCTAFGLTVHIDTMGCDFLITGSGMTTGVVHIVCSTTAGGVTDEITLTATQGGATICHISLPEQTANMEIGNLGGPPDDISNSLSGGTNLTYSVVRTVGGSKCPTEGHHKDGTLTNNITVRAYSDEAHTSQVGLTYQ